MALLSVVVLRTLILSCAATVAAKGDDATVSLSTPWEIAEHAVELFGAGEKSLGRAFVSLALHLNPWVAQKGKKGSAEPTLSGKARKAVAEVKKVEPLTYWEGNAFLGHDKTFVEGLFSQEHLWQGHAKLSAALYAWRNVQLTGESCCGIQNLAVFFAQASLHLYIVPFMNLVPGLVGTMLPANKQMYESFKNWWESIGRPPMPEPAIQYTGRGQFEWPIMKVMLKKSRIPSGFPELIQAVLCWRLNEESAAGVFLRQGLAKNKDLEGPAGKLLPQKLLRAVAGQAPISQKPASTKHQYVAIYKPHVGLGNVAVVLVSAYALARLTGRSLLISWNSQVGYTFAADAFKLKQQPDVALAMDDATLSETGVVYRSSYHLHFFHMMFSSGLGDVLELLGCSDLSAFKQSQAPPVDCVSIHLICLTRVSEDCLQLSIRQ
eukprot:TRINITY_DN23143_c0_g1_i5.p1 TRINITY_DN23143_c0_g1~~TRINITY_DN23143_c0_g1_i5.p1  ORF type:complete len:453 (-),score=79.35 TRINITY_DN23143_c0_g1_i5:281-1585(-)